MWRRRRGRWGALAYAISVALHALLLALLLRLPPPGRPEHTLEPIPVELVEVPPAGAGGIAGPPVAARGGRGGRSRAGTAAGAPPARGSRGWMETEGLEPVPGGRRGTALIPGEIRDSLRGGVGPEMRDPSLPEDAAVSGARVRRRVKAWIEDFKAVERAQYPDEYWSRVRERLAKGFEPDWSVLEGGARPSGAPPAGLRDAIEGYRAGAGRYGATGSPFGRDPAAPGARGDRTSETADLLRDLPGGSGGLSPAARGLLDWRRGGGGAFHRELVTLVLFRQAEDGSVISAAMVESSGNAAYDRLVMGRARSLGEEAVRELGPPPKQGRRTLWAFATDFDMVPPAPVIGCGFDAWFVPRDCVWPLKKTTKPRVKLRAVYE